MKKQLFILLLSVSTYAVNPPRKTHVVLDFGVYVTRIDRRSQVPGTYISKVTHTRGMVRLRPAFNIGKGFFLELGPALHLPWQSHFDGSSKAYTFHTELNLAVESHWFRSRIGTGLQWQYFTSKGESVVQSNGGGTSTFYLPDRSTNVFIGTLQAGLSFNFSHSIMLNLDLYSTAPFSRSRRHFDGSVSLGIRL